MCGRNCLRLRLCWLLRMRSRLRLPVRLRLRLCLVPADAHVQPILTQLLVQLDVICILARSRAPRPTKLACYTQDATKFLVQFDVLCIVAGLQHKLTSTYIHT